MERVPVEVWQQILLKAMEANDWPMFATSCTPYTFLDFVFLRTSQQMFRKPSLDYLAQHRCLRPVCRAWNELVLSASHRWLSVDEQSPIYNLDPTTSSRAKGGVGPVEGLSTEIHWDGMVTPALSWASHILKRPASQSPLRAYTLRLYVTPVPGYNPLNNLLAGTRTTTTHNPECTNPECTNTTLHSLSIITSSDISISIPFSQIFHESALALPNQSRGGAATDINSSTPRGIIRSISPQRLERTAAVD